MQDNSTIVRYSIGEAIKEGDLDSAGQFELSRDRKKSAIDLQALTTIQQNNFTPQLPPARGPITLTVCVTPHPSTTSRQHYSRRTVPLYMERRI